MMSSCSEKDWVYSKIVGCRCTGETRLPDLTSIGHCSDSYRQSAEKMNLTNRPL